MQNLKKENESIWHSPEEEPTEDDYVLVRINLGYDNRTGEDIIFYDLVKMVYGWEDYLYSENVERWCYISDLQNL